jgi:hypothetical protein
MSKNYSSNDHGHKMNEPWQTLGSVRDDLRQARGRLRRVLGELQGAHTAPGESDIRAALALVGKALGRIGDGTREGEVGAEVRNHG